MQPAGILGEGRPVTRALLIRWIISKENHSPLAQVPESEIRRIQKADKEAERMKGTFRTRFDFLMED